MVDLVSMTAAEVVKRSVARTGPAWTWIGATVGLLCLLSWQTSLGGSPSAPLIWLSDRLNLDFGWVENVHDWVADPVRVDFLVLVGRWGIYALIAGAAVDEFLRARTLNKIDQARESSTYRPTFRTVDGSRRRHPISEDESAAFQAGLKKQAEDFKGLETWRRAAVDAQIEHMRRSGGSLWLLVGLLAETGRASLGEVPVFVLVSVLAAAAGTMIGTATSGERLERGDVGGSNPRGVPSQPLPPGHPRTAASLHRGLGHRRMGLSCSALRQPVDPNGRLRSTGGEGMFPTLRRCLTPGGVWFG